LENGAKVLVLIVFSQLADKKVNPPQVPSAAPDLTTSIICGLTLLGVFCVVFTAGFSDKLLGEMRLLRSEVSLLRLAVEKLAGQQ
jgi:hypothetical protein